MKHPQILIFVFMLIAGCSPAPVMSILPLPPITSSPIPATSTLTPSPLPPTATTLTPLGTLGRDLYDEVSTGFDPEKAKELLTEAGYSDPSLFPAITLIVNSYGDIAPGARFNMENAFRRLSECPSHCTSNVW